MKKILFIGIVVAGMFAGCNGEKKERSPFEAYPPSSYYCDLPCVDSLINEFGDPVFIYEDSDHVRTFVELMDTILLINGYVAPEWHWSAQEKQQIKSLLK